MNKPIISIWGYFGHANTGDEAILSVALDELRKHELADDITVFSGNPATVTRDHGVKAVPALLPTSLSEHLVGSLGRNRANYKSCMRAYDRSDLIIVGGGGLFFDLEEHNTFLLNLLTLIERALNAKKRVALIGVGVGPIHHEESKNRMREVLNRVDLIVVRENDSRQLLEQIGVENKNLNVAADLAFLLGPSPDDRVETLIKDNGLTTDSRPVVAVCLNGRHVERPGYLDTFVTCCEHLIEKQQATIWFVPFQTLESDGQSAPDTIIDLDDRSGMRQIANRIEKQDHVGFVEQAYRPSEIMGLLARADLVIGERFHGALLSINNRRPVLGVSYMPKVARLFDELGHSDWCHDFNQLDHGQLIESLEMLLENRDRVSSELAIFSDRMREKASLNYQLLADLVKEN